MAKKRHCYTGRTGSGKRSAPGIPSLLRLPDSPIVINIKAEIYRPAAAARAGTEDTGSANPPPQPTSAAAGQ
jgi:hypothetical protein